MTIDTIFRWTVEYPGKIILCNVDCIFEMEGKGVKRMAANLGEEIRQAEENSKRIIQDAKVETPDIITTADADIAQLVEHRLPKPRVAGSNPVVRSKGNERRPKKGLLFIFSRFGGV